MDGMTDTLRDHPAGMEMNTLTGEPPIMAKMKTMIQNLRSLEQTCMRLEQRLSPILEHPVPENSDQAKNSEPSEGKIIDFLDSANRDIVEREGYINRIISRLHV